MRRQNNFLKDVKCIDDALIIVWKNGLCGYKTLEGQMITEFKYDDANCFTRGFAKVYKNNFIGLIDIYGNEVIDLIYQKVEELSYYIFKVQKDYKWSMINLLNKKPLLKEYDKISSYSEGLICVEFKNKIGFMNENGVEIIPISYDYIEFDLDWGSEVFPFFNNGYVLLGKGKSHILFNKNGKELISYIPVCNKNNYSELYKLPELINGFALLKIDNRYLLLNNEGETIIDIESEFAQFMTNEIIIIKDISKKYGCYNTSGELIIPSIYDEITCIDNTLFRVKINNNFGIIDSYNNIIIPIIFSRIIYVCDNWVIVTKNNKYGVINSHNEKIIPIEYERIYFSTFNDGIGKIVTIMKDNNNLEETCTGFINECGEIVIPFGYNNCWVDDFHDGLAIIHKDGKYGFINSYGNLEIQMIYDEIEPFKNKLAKIRIDDKYGYIDNKGTVIVPIIYDEVESFKNGLLTVKNEDKIGVVDFNGKEIISVIYDEILRCDDLDETYSEFIKNGKLIIAKSKFKYELFDFEGKVIVEKNKYSSISFCESGLIKISITINKASGFGSNYDDIPSFNDIEFCKYHRFGYIDCNGIILIPPQYEIVEGTKEGILKVSSGYQNDLYGLFDYNKNEIIIPLIYKTIQIVEAGLLKVQNVNSKFGYVDTQHKTIIPIKYDDISVFFENKAIFQLNGDRGYIDESGNILKVFNM